MPTGVVSLETELPTDAERVWGAMQQASTFLYVCHGLFSFPVLAGRTEPLKVGDSGSGWLFAFHVIPAYRHHIRVVEVDEATHTIRTNEHGGSLRTWNHTLHVEQVADGCCRYRDRIEIDAGRLTPVAVRLATAIFRYRQRRWHKLVRQHLLPSGPAYLDR